MSYLIIFIVIYNACYPSHEKLSYLQIDTHHVKQVRYMLKHSSVKKNNHCDLL